MEIKQNIDVFGNETYEIRIEQSDNVEPLEIAESFKRQFPKRLCLIIFAKVTAVELGMYFVGLNLRRSK